MSYLHGALALVIALVAGTLMVVSGRRSWRPSLGVAVLVAVAFRVVMLVITHEVAPADVVDDFSAAGRNVLEHQDPTLNSRPRGWSYLPTYAFLLAGMVHVQDATGLPWLWIVRVLPIVFDVGVVVMVFLLSSPDRRGLAAFQYACLPLAIMVSAIHGQMEPLCLLLALAAFLVVRRSANGAGMVLAGGLIALSISVKSWPVIFLPALLIGLPHWRARLQLLGSGAVLGLALWLTMPLTVGTPWRELPTVLATMLGYSPAGGTFGWSAIAFIVNPYDYESFEISGLWHVIGRIGTVLSVVGITLAIWWWRRAEPEVIARVTAWTFQVTTAGHGVQYLLWATPFDLIAPTRLVTLLHVAVSTWASVGYIVLLGGLVPSDSWALINGLYALSSLLVVGLIVAALPWRHRVRDEPAVKNEPAAADRGPPSRLRHASG